MNTAQPGIFAQGSRAHMQLEFTISDAVAVEKVRASLDAFRTAVRGYPSINYVLGFGGILWRRICAPADRDVVREFRTVTGKDHVAPATQRDLWIWIHGTGPDVVLDAARGATEALMDVAVLELDLPCFVYKDSRDLSGFIDGTENPPMDEAVAVALFPPGAPGAGGAVALTQKWVHDLKAFGALTLSEQEMVFGRTRLESTEIDDRPANAHISRVVIEDNGEELEIYRRSVPFGTVREQGLYFIAFTNDQPRIDRMLSRMYGTDADGITDRVLDFSQAKSGSYWFVPSLETLVALIEQP
jgi:putative iron-dependent peroxidase